MQQKKLIKAIKQSIALSLGLFSVLSFAEEPKAKSAVQKISVTGSSIKGVSAQSASPITILKTEDLAKQGVTTAEQALSMISANQSTFVAANNVGTSGTSGSVADLRGLGPNKTLVLLNGRRLANTPYDSSTVDLSTLPLALIERIEVLKDGASAIYGTDAIGGVINFITKKNYVGAGASVDIAIPEAAGGKTQQYSFFAGHGDLEQQGYNVFAALNYRHQDAVMASQRTFSQRGGILPELGLNVTSSATFPANIAGIGNPYAVAGCGGNPNNHAELGYCRYNAVANVGIVPESATMSVLGRGTYKLNDNLNATFEYMHSEDELTVTVAPDVMLGGGDDYFISADSPYYPGNGITPTMDGITGQELSLNLRAQAGNRISERFATSNRVLAGLEGSLGHWDLDTAIQYAQSKVQDRFVSGYVNNQLVRDGLASGVLNPFGASADANYWDDLDVRGMSLEAELKSFNFDITLSRPIYTLPAGEVGFAIGAALRKDDWFYKQNAAVNSLVEGSGADATAADNSGDRQVQAIYSELQIPILKSLTAQVAARYDHYSDFGGTLNPKLALRWQPTKTLMLRSSFSTGFRAPSLYELNYSSSLTNTASSWNDPLLCPNGNVATGGSQIRDCNIQFKTLVSGNQDLEPETSTSYNLGVVFQPIKNLVLTADYFNIEVKNQINVVSESAIFQDTEKYADRFVRNADQSLAYIDQTYSNMGATQTSGVDLGLQWRSPVSQYGRLGLSLEGTYVDTFRFKVDANSDWDSSLGRYNNAAGQETNSVVPRWKHTANINWNFKDWHLNLQQNFFKGYLDQNSNGQNHRVSDYTVYNLSGTYSGFKKLSLTLGIKNLFDTDPPATNSIDNFQYGYDPRYSDPLGRTYYGRFSYKF